jgi:hypothetical protein
LQDFAVTGVVGSFKLLEHMLAGQHQTLLLTLASDLGRSQWWLGWARSRHGFRLLLLDRLAFPSSRHPEIIPAKSALLPGFVQMLDTRLAREAKDRVGDLDGDRAKLARKVPSWHQKCHFKK